MNNAAGRKHLSTTLEEYKGTLENSALDAAFTMDNLVKDIEAFKAIDQTDLILILNTRGTYELLDEPEFKNLLDPVSLHELITTGKLAALVGISVYTDKYTRDEDPHIRFTKTAELRCKGTLQ